MALTPEQRAVLATIKQVAAKKGASPKQVKAAIETGIVESNLSNPSGGDADSAGWRQERSSLYKDPTNLKASIGRFFDETAAVKGKYGRAGDLAAAVQRPAAQYRGRYQQQSGRADQLLGSGSSGGGASSSQGSSSRSTTTTTTPGVDNSAGRRAAIAAFLGDTGADPVSFALQIRGLQDTRGTSTTKTTKTSTAGSSSAGSAKSAKAQGLSPLKELFWQGQNGIDAKNGVKVPQGFVSGHQDHVHVAAGPKTVVILGKLAQKMGLRVGENSHFGGSTPTSGHAANSYHYKDEAIDVSGDPKVMAHFAAYVAHKYGLKVHG